MDKNIKLTGVILDPQIHIPIYLLVSHICHKVQIDEILQWRKQVEKSGGAIINGHVIGGCVTQY